MFEMIQTILKSIDAYWARVSTYNPIVVAVELLLIGVVVWWVMRFLRGPAGRLVKGAALLLATLYVGIRLLPKSYGWDRIEWLYGQVPPVRVRGPDRGLPAGAAPRADPDRPDQVLPLLARAARRDDRRAGGVRGVPLRNKIGAVVAVERSVGLGTLLEAGQVIDSRVTSSLLNTIFYPGSPLHDMGVVIRGGRVRGGGVPIPAGRRRGARPVAGKPPPRGPGPLAGLRRRRAGHQRGDRTHLHRRRGPAATSAWSRRPPRDAHQPAFARDPARQAPRRGRPRGRHAMIARQAQSARRFSRSWWFAQARALAWTAVITLLIWIYADLEFTEVHEFTITVHFEAAPGSTLVLSSLADQDREVTFPRAATSRTWRSTSRSRSPTATAWWWTFRPCERAITACRSRSCSRRTPISASPA